MNSSPVKNDLFALWDRVRVKDGAFKGCYGVIRRADGSQTYGVLLDVHAAKMAYFQHELELAK